MNSAATLTPPSRGPGKKAFKPKGRYGPTGLTVMAAAHILLAYGLATAAAAFTY